ncbi:MAG: bifunctional phosphoribosyl-AMP cyclohydrolase/phosphoribosyl-ATP diphosphatase HisIE [Pyrinomonadaceae bacterium]|nr:bifunctional phosphoribosyl-AMP cyclohydrolase/phosphoribosyl-ATP diphosphatase HisIE [Pyrinomonadaceae bacterium]
MIINFEKYADGLVPTIIQDYQTNKVLMLGFMNAESLQKTQETKKVTFYSRSRNTLWTKGETSGNFLYLKELSVDCDNDTILIKAIPNGAVCHTGEDTCFAEINESDDFLYKLEKIIQLRKLEPSEKSYTSKLLAKGINKVAQKVGEEAVELVIEAKDDNEDLFKNEAADLLYHFLVLLAAKDIDLKSVIEVLKERHGK